MESRTDFDFELLASCLNYNPETGELHWKISKGKSKAGKLAGCRHKKYLKITFQGRTYLAHRIIWSIYYKESPPDIIDHIDGDGFNNKISNLRSGTDGLNQQNQKQAHSRNKTSSMLGVSNFNGRWRAKIYHKGKYIFLGYHATQALASEAYLKAKEEIHAGFVKN